MSALRSAPRGHAAVEVALERGVYFDAWFPRQHCYHPSLPPRRLRMVEELADYRATVLVWSALGGGSVSLPYLEQEAFAPVDERFRFYGFVNDSEFIRACHKVGIKVFGVIFEAQGWEFPVELNQAEDTVLSMNELRGEGQRSWLGLREFTQNRYPKLWAPFEHYFPDGLRNSDGEPVRDLLEECCSRDIDGNPCFARWVECPDRDHQCYYMDRNNPVWREYLKAVIRIQIDAGVDGVQLDEASTPITALQYAGCFCKDCVKGFRAHLQALPTTGRPAELEGIDLADFDYGDWLRRGGHDVRASAADTPLFWDYLRYQRRATAAAFAELAEYARSYAASNGRSVLITANFFNLFDQYLAYEPSVDIVVTEMRNTSYRQPAWYRYVAGFAGTKPTLVVENPYGGVIPDLIGLLGRGKGYDLFRLSMYEAAALGACSMTLPYGSWMGSVTEDAFYAPPELCREVHGFLADHERLLSRDTYAELAVVYSVPSNWQRVARRDQFADLRENASSGDTLPFWEVAERLSDLGQPYDVVIFPEDDTRAAADLRRYRALYLPDCRELTRAQAALLRSYLDNGGRLFVLGELGLNLPDDERQGLLTHAQTRRLESVEAGLEDPQVCLDASLNGRLGLNVQRTDDGAVVHLIRYDYDSAADTVPTLDRLTLAVRLPETFDRCETVSPAGAPKATLAVDGSLHRIEIRDVPLYTMVVLRPAGSGGTC